jgi:hypothetical protein
MLMPAPSPATSTAIGPEFHRNRLKLPVNVGGLTYSYEADEGSSVADISAEGGASSGWIRCARVSDPARVTTVWSPLRASPEF